MLCVLYSMAFQVSAELPKRASLELGLVLLEQQLERESREQ